MYVEKKIICIKPCLFYNQCDFATNTKKQADVEKNILILSPAYNRLLLFVATNIPKDAIVAKTAFYYHCRGDEKEK